MRTRAILSCTLAFCVTAVFGQAPQAPSAPARFVLEAGEHDLVKVIEDTARFLGRNYLLSPTEIGAQRPKVTLQQRIDVDAAGCEATLTQLAYTHSLVAIPLDRARGLWEIVNANGPRRADIQSRAIPVTLAELKEMRDLRVAVTTQVPMKHVRATVAVQTLRPFFASSGSVSLNLGTAGNEGVILLQGMTNEVLHAVETIANIDQPEPLPKVAADRIAALEARVKTLEATVAQLVAARADQGK